MKEIDNIIKESINRVIVEKNQMRNVENISTVNECYKVMNHLKAAMNVWKKIGQYDSQRGQAGSWWSTAMKLMKQANDIVNSYSWNETEAEIHNSPSELTNATMGKTFQSKPKSFDKIKKEF